VPIWHFRIFKGQILHFGLHFGREIEKILKLFVSIIFLVGLVFLQEKSKKPRGKIKMHLGRM